MERRTEDLERRRRAHAIKIARSVGATSDGDDVDVSDIDHEALHAATVRHLASVGVEPSGINAKAMAARPGAAAADEAESDEGGDPDAEDNAAPHTAKRAHSRKRR